MAHDPHTDVDFVRDTSAEALSVFHEIQRKRPVGQKLVDVFDLSEGLFETVKAGIRLRYPEADERQVFLRAVASRVPRELMIRAYGWDPAMNEQPARGRSHVLPNTGRARHYLRRGRQLGKLVTWRRACVKPAIQTYGQRVKRIVQGVRKTGETVRRRAETMRRMPFCKSAGKHSIIADEAMGEIIEISGAPPTHAPEPLIAIREMQRRNILYPRLSKGAQDSAVPQDRLLEGEHVPNEPEVYLDQRYID